MENEELLLRTQWFSLRIMNLVENLPTSKSFSVISGQILRSATSVGANYRAARRAKSGSDLVNKLKIVEEEADETLYWLELIQRSGHIPATKMDDIVNEANALVAIFVTSIRTAKLNGRGERKVRS